MCADREYLAGLLAGGRFGGPVLEIGSRDWNGNMAQVVSAAGLTWEGCDLEPGPGVDFTLDILDEHAVADLDRRWGTVLLFNLLEHVYDPAAALRNALALVAPAGRCVVCGPVVWELHRYPRDYWRPMPDFFDEFARRHGCDVEDACWLLTEWPYVPGRAPRVRVIPVEDLGQIPSRLNAQQVWGPVRTATSVTLQRALNLTGRVNRFPNVALGLVLSSR
jgi:hypothetical protein